MTVASDAHATDDVAAILEAADQAEAAGDFSRTIALLTDAVRRRSDVDVEARLVRVRHAAFAGLRCSTGVGTAMAPFDAIERSTDGTIPEIPRAELTASRVRDAIARSGSLCVRGLVPTDEADRMVNGIDHSIEARAARRTAARGVRSPWFLPLPLGAEAEASLGRRWINGSGGVLTADSPRMLFLLLDLFERIGLRQVVEAHLGERPVLSANKATLRRVPVTTSAGWHQDGAFLGRGIRALNVWLALSPCGRDAPGLDVLPRRLDHIVETGTGGAFFDWAVGPDVVAGLARETPIVRPVFEAGDALIFDDLLLHQTGIDPGMTRPRYAIESWFFAPSAYPEGHVPIVW